MSHDNMLSEDESANMAINHALYCITPHHMACRATRSDQTGNFVVEDEEQAFFFSDSGRLPASILHIPEEE